MSVDLICVLILFFISFSSCGYQPTGDEVQPGSVLLPATRRGRYLANIVRRQAVDGTGIKFNKDADRMNAEAKKKVDVLSEELLPYIIAEQERRTTLYKRIMTAIQNGEKGVTIAEMRSKPPLIIRKGLLYRCPTNLLPKEPDGSGLIMCEDEIEPTQIMYDSCLSAEDKELYVAENKYFFCNRHKIEGPDLPRNGSTVIGCAPIERTSLNYTTSRCALEATDDVVVHYRYYPDRTYKFVTELDPDKEVCDHWNPCQIGYIFSLPSPDQAMLASELWHNFVEDHDEYERDEFVPPIPSDRNEEFVSQKSKNYTSSTKKIVIPEGYKFNDVVFTKKGATRKSHSAETRVPLDKSLYTAKISKCGRFVKLTLNFPDWSIDNYGNYEVEAVKKNGKDAPLYLKAFYLTQSSISIQARSMEVHLGQRANATSIPMRCSRCQFGSIMVRANDGSIYVLDTAKYRKRHYIDKQGKRQLILEIGVEGNTPQSYGDYFALMYNGDGYEEKVRLLTVLSPEKDPGNMVQTTRITASYEVGKHVELSMNYSCESCELDDILCNGESMVPTDNVHIITAKNLATFNFPRFEDSVSCVYMGSFNDTGKIFTKILAVIENNSPAVTIPKVDVLNAPNEGEQFEHEVPYICDNCLVDKVYVNGIPLETSTRRSSLNSIAFYVTSPTAITIRITEYTPTFEGVFQAVFSVDDEKITKTIMEIKSETETPTDGTTAASSAGFYKMPIFLYD
ncbi:uncharacterized protein LOC124535907 [Vanessa cardui]|uniref:uncharacterized protein LOC124535907 n=1 Tax=Vanessa cardui TaxID=171605 RepID=UPI001F1328D1|nr:uncharacterized protein LOC124535907 [Vanessa cardui]